MTCRPALGATGADGEVLHDPFLDLVEPVVVRVEHFAGAGEVGDVLGRDAPGQLEHGVQPGADPGCLGALVAGPLELVDLAEQGLAHGVGDVGLLDPGPVVVGLPLRQRLALSQFFADRGELLAEQELALALLHALADVLADLVGDLLLGEVLTGPLDEAGQPLLDVGSLEKLALAVDREVRRVAGRVRDAARVAHLGHRVDDLPGLTALEDRDDESLVLLGELTGVLRHVLVDGVDLDPEGRAGARHAAADAAALLGLQHRGRGPAAEPADPLDAGDDAVRRVAVLEPRGDEQPAVAAGARGVDRGLGGLVELDRHDHPGSTTVSETKRTGSDEAGHRDPPFQT